MPVEPSARRLSEYRFEKAATWREKLGAENYRAIHRGLLNHSMAKLFGENWRKREAKENLVLEPSVKRFIDAHFESHLQSIGKRIEEGRMLGGELLANDAAFRKAFAEGAPEGGLKYSKEITDLTRLLVEKKHLMTPEHRATVNSMLQKFYEAKQPKGYEEAYHGLAEELKHREMELSSAVLPVKERQKWEKFLGKDVFDSLTTHMRTRLLGPEATKGKLSENQERTLANTLRGFLSMVERDITKQELDSGSIANISDHKLKEQLDAYVSGQRAGAKTGRAAQKRPAAASASEREKELEKILEEARKKHGDEREEDKKKHADELEKLQKMLEEERKKREEDKKATEGAKKEESKKEEGKTASKPTIYKIPVVAGPAPGGGAGGAGEEWWKKNVVAWGAILAAVIIILLFLTSIIK